LSEACYILKQTALKQGNTSNYNYAAWTHEISYEVNKHSIKKNSECCKFMAAETMESSVLSLVQVMQKVAHARNHINHESMVKTRS